MSKRNKFKKVVRKLKPERELCIRNQKVIYERLILNSISKVLVEIKGTIGEGITEDKVAYLNMLLRKTVEEVWVVLRKEGRIFLPLESVIPFFLFKNDTGKIELKLTSDLVNLANGTLDPLLVPLELGCQSIRNMRR